jgi:hypothetical protein
MQVLDHENTVATKFYSPPSSSRHPRNGSQQSGTPTRATRLIKSVASLTSSHLHALSLLKPTTGITTYLAAYANAGLLLFAILRLPGLERFVLRELHAG